MKEIREENKQIFTNKVNLLTHKFIADVYSTLENRRTISRMNFTKQDIQNVLGTIWIINSMDKYDTMIDTNISLSDYEIPSMFKQLVFPLITLSGNDEEERLVKFEFEEGLSIDIPSRLKMIDIANAIYGSQREKVSTFNVEDIVKSPRPLSEYTTNITVGDSVTTRYEDGIYPINTIVDIFVKQKYGSLSTDLAIENYINIACALRN